LNHGVVDSTTNFNATGQIFLPPDGTTTPENWTRPGFFAFAPTLSDSVLQGTYGTLDLQSSGAWTYGLANSQANVQQLTSSSPPQSDNFTVKAADNHSQTATDAVNISVYGDSPTLAVEIVGAPGQGHPAAPTYSQFLAFGDSDIDSGYFLHHNISNNSSVQTQYNASAAAGGGVPTSLDTQQLNPGRLMNSELLAGDYGLTALPDDGMGGGTNFAASGATVTNPLAGSLAPTIDSQIKNYLAAHNNVVDPNALILLSGGGNDATIAETMDPVSAQNYMISHAQLLAADIAQLAQDGARYIIMGDLSGPGALGSLFTSTLQSTLAADGVQFIPADVKALIQAIKANPAAYGIVNANTPPAGPFTASFPYNTGLGGADVNPNPATFSAGWANFATQLVSANAGQTDLYADDEHLAAAGQQIEANYLQSLIQNAAPGVGETLTASPTLIGSNGSTANVTYQWQRLALGQTQWSDIAGATGSTYAVQSADEGSRLRVEAFFTDPATSVALSATSLETFAVQNAVPFDVNGDSISDLVFQNNGQPGIWLWNGTAPTAEVGLPNPGASWHIITSRDVNGDGKADLIWQNSDGTPGIWLMNGTTPTSEVGLANPGPSWHLVASGDTDGDGKSDLIWQNTDGTLGVWLMNGTTPTAEAAIGNPGANWKVVGAADYNGDGQDDILLQDTNTGNLMIDLMNGTTISSTKTLTIGDPSWHAVSTGEFNGQAEIAWQNSNGTVGLWLMNGTTPAAEVGLANPGAGWQLVSIDHFTPNGQADLLFQNTSGAIGLWELNGTSVAAMVNLPNPTAAWQSVNGHPFATG
jgi:VCBS repeat-containing protein